MRMEFITFHKEKFQDDWLSEMTLETWWRAYILESDFRTALKRLPPESEELLFNLQRSAKIYFAAYDNGHDIWCQDERYNRPRGTVPRSNYTMEMWAAGGVSTVLDRFSRDVYLYYYCLCDEAWRLQIPTSE